MNTEDYVSYPVALALKKHGFDWECDRYYDRKNQLINTNPSAWNWNSDNIPKFIHPKCSSPSLSQAAKWLREEWGIHVNVCIYSDYSTDADGKVCDRWDFWGFNLYAVVGGDMMEAGDGEYDSYEQALSAGIAAALELIGEKGE